jgi:hypothetical protein
MIEELLGREDLSQYEVIALGKLLQDIYTGIERILRTLLENKGIKTRKTESWHKDLLVAAKRRSIISEDEFGVFGSLLVFRHMEIHGYGFLLDETRLRELAEPLPVLIREFLTKLT